MPCSSIGGWGWGKGGSPESLQNFAHSAVWGGTTEGRAPEPTDLLWVKVSLPSSHVRLFRKFKLILLGIIYIWEEFLSEHITYNFKWFNLVFTLHPQKYFSLFSIVSFSAHSLKLFLLLFCSGWHAVVWSLLLSSQMDHTFFQSTQCVFHFCLVPRPYLSTHGETHTYHLISLKAYIASLSSYGFHRTKLNLHI